MRCAAPSALLQRLRRATPKTLQPSGQRIDGCYTALLLPCASQRRGMRAPLAPLVHVAVRWRQACSCVLRLLIANPKTPRRLRPSTSNKDCRRPRPSSARPERRTLPASRRLHLSAARPRAAAINAQRRDCVHESHDIATARALRSSLASNARAQRRARGASVAVRLTAPARLSGPRLADACPPQPAHDSCGLIR